MATAQMLQIPFPEFTTIAPTKSAQLEISKNPCISAKNVVPLQPKYNGMEENFRFIDLFAGIGGIRLGFESIGGTCVFSSEFDEDACTTYQANFGEHPAGDITKIEASDIPDFDVLLAGFPCQAFSIIGKKM